MKRNVFLLIVAIMLGGSASVQAQSENNDWAVNTRAWSTNYFTSGIYAVAKFLVVDLVTDNPNDSLLIERIVPDPCLVFPVGVKKQGFDDPYDIYSPYHRAFSNPFKRLGDYAIGIDASWSPSVVGLYAGAYFKSQEIVYKNTKDNLRGFYFQPRVGLSLNLGESRQNGLEAGIYYDVVTGCGGSVANPEKDMLKGGLGLDFALKLLSTNNKNSVFVVQYSMPLHNFLNKDYAGGAFSNMDRRVGYIMVTSRVLL